MNEEGIAWFKELKRYVAECRRQRPLPNRSDLSLAEETQCRIIGESQMGWLNNNRQKLFEGEDVVGDTEGLKYLVFTSNQSGLVSSREIFSDSSNVTFLLPTEFEDWKQTYPDSIFKWHIHFCSSFGSLSPLHEFLLQKPETRDGTYLVAGKSFLEKYPLNSGESYWVYEQGTTWGVLHGNGENCLWKWNGVEAVFVRNLGRWVS